jgi:ribosomal protein S12 methylthiotransferase
MEAIDTILELGEAKKEGRIKKIIVTGCLSERYKDEMLRELPEIDALLGVGSYEDIVTAVKTVLGGKTYTKFGPNGFPDPEIYRTYSQHRCLGVPEVREGCDRTAAPTAFLPDIRGPFWSRRLRVFLRGRALAAGETKSSSSGAGYLAVRPGLLWGTTACRSW